MTCPCCPGQTDSETDGRCLRCQRDHPGIRVIRRGTPIPEGPTVTPQQLAAAKRVRAFFVPVEDAGEEDPDHGF